MSEIVRKQFQGWKYCFVYKTFQQVGQVIIHIFQLIIAAFATANATLVPHKVKMQYVQYKTQFIPGVQKKS